MGDKKKTDIQQAKEILIHENKSCVFVKDNIVYSEIGMGISPIIKILSKNVDLSGFCVADKLVGKAAAMLFVYAKATEVFSFVMSKSAITVFEEYNIKYSFEREVDTILNRDESDLCPMEKLVANIESPKLAFEAVSQVIKL